MCIYFENKKVWEVKLSQNETRAYKWTYKEKGLPKLSV
jgi:hypothetical protein